MHRNTTEIASGVPARKQRLGSMSFLSEIFQQESEELSPAQEPEMTMSEFREFQKSVSESMGNVVTNATLKIEMAKFLAAKKSAAAAVVVSEPEHGGELKGTMNKLFSVSRFRGFKTTIEAATATQTPKSLSTDQQDNLHNRPRSKSPKQTLLAGLAEEKVPKEPSSKTRKKNTRASFILNAFPAMEELSDELGNSFSLPPLVHCSSKTLNFDDDSFIDGLAFFTGTDSDQMRDKMVAEYNNSASVLTLPTTAKGA